MRETQLILIDGLPGSGKTTTATILAKRLRTHGIPVQYLLEIAEPGQEHPLTVGGTLHPAGRTTGQALFAAYTSDSYIEESLRRWRAFAGTALSTGAVWIVESYPYQNSVRVLLQMDAGTQAIRSYAAAVEEIAVPLRPLLLFFERADGDTQLQEAVQQRGPQWAAYIAELVTSAPYALHHGLQGVEGALAFMETYRALVADLRQRSHIPELVLEGGPGRWDRCLQQSLAFLDAELAQQSP